MTLALNIALSFTFMDDAQRSQAMEAIEALKAEGLDIVTELSPSPEFYPAEDYHQNFFARNPTPRLLQLCHSSPNY